jgi:predicted transcriptional regulator
MNNTIDMNFPITVYGNLEKFTDVMSLGRCRIFYKYDNRNGTYITDEFAEELIKTLPYTPVKGIYDTDDYTDHGTKREEGRIYGIVPGPQDMNFAWEKHLDEDGVEREYACVNVYYYTALYEEAGEICGKGQSMELYRKSVKGDWKIINGKRYYVFEKASFLGLQVLGDDVEPCFEGAAFFSLYESVKDLYEKLEQYQNNFQNHGEGGNEMPTITFKVSDSQKHDYLWSLLNVNYNEEGGWAVEYGICDIYDEYAIVRNYAEGKFERVYYTKNDETDSLEITNREDCFIVDVNEAEKNALKNLHTHNGGTYECVDTNYVSAASLYEANNSLTAANATIEELNGNITTLTEQNSEFSTKIEELTETISTLNTDKESMEALYAEANDKFTAVSDELTTAKETIVSLTEERDALATFKKNIMDNEKKAVINGYTDQLDAEIIETYMNDLDKYTAQQLDMELTYKVKTTRPDLFAKVPAASTYIPKDTTPSMGGLETLLAKYENKH